MPPTTPIASGTPAGKPQAAFERLPSCGLGHSFSRYSEAVSRPTFDEWRQSINHTGSQFTEWARSVSVHDQHISREGQHNSKASEDKFSLAHLEISQ